MLRFPAWLPAAALALLFGRELPAQTLSHALPGAIVPGRTTEVVLHGAKLGGARLWTSFPADVQITSDANAKDPAQIACNLTLAAGVPTGLGGIAVATPAGLSDVLYVMIDELPSVA